ncbi:hypothetical protein [Chelativorans salis]|uniref:AAA family ATPase n=1 Tax=Chelativorans salis TaxID=2978478 RepID=A0ABT2LP63_9HYPH|nr:hypothetical protein [Chelativorans sp. EGI FJ00035]MCT7376350.1 hypothetical protein [Chelativorans sp. EGI FJ00035]
MPSDHLLNAITSSFIASTERDGFNGVIASTLSRIEEEPERLRNVLAGLITDGSITAVFARTSVNMHIKRFPDLPIPRQLELLRSEDLADFSLYPTEAEVRRRVDLSAWHDRPFSKALLLAEPQLAFRAFDMGALERYVSDPRYKVHFADYMGRMSITDDFFTSEQHPERDKVSLQTFGLGFDAQRTPYTIVFLRYLAGLSAEHQQYWNSYLASNDVRMSEPYYRSSIEGEFWKNRSVRYAITEEMRLIRTLSEAIWGQSLFRASTEGDIPIGLTSFLRPTAENFNRFVMALDKLLSESIDASFFIGKCPLETEETRSDGKTVVARKGTLALLEEWLLQEIVWDDPNAFREMVIKPLRQVRRLRQTPAHTFTTDDFSTEYYDKRNRLLWAVFNSLSNIRATFAKHPLAGHIEIPNWLNNDRIDVF